MTDLPRINDEDFIRFGAEKRDIVRAVDKATNDVGWFWLMRDEGDDRMVIECRRDIMDNDPCVAAGCEGGYEARTPSDIDGQRVVIIENPKGWYGEDLVGKGGFAHIEHEASMNGQTFYHLTPSFWLDPVAPWLLFARSRLEVMPRV